MQNSSIEHTINCVTKKFVLEKHKCKTLLFNYKNLYYEKKKKTWKKTLKALQSF